MREFELDGKKKVRRGERSLMMISAPVRLELTTFRLDIYLDITVGRCNQLSHGARAQD